MKLWTRSILWTVSLLLLSGCSLTPKPKENVTVDSNLPVVTLTSSGIKVGMKSIAFEWESIKDPAVEGIFVYRKVHSPEQEPTLAYYATIQSRFKTHYVDTEVLPDTRYSYAFKTFTKNSESKQSATIEVNTLPVLQSVAWIHSISGMPRTAKIIWRPHESEKVKAYIIERKTADDKEWEKIATVDGRLNAEFIDEDLKDNFVYLYRIRVLTYDKIVSTPSEIVKLVTKPLPLSIENIRTTTNIPKKIKIDWNVSTQKDFALYYVYRSEKSDGSYTLIAKLFNNTFTDNIDEDEKTYYYRVSAVDVDGLESENEKQTVKGMTLSRPKAPDAITVSLVNSQANIQWSNKDPRTKSYVLTRKHKEGWFKYSVAYFEIKEGTKFVDTKIEPSSTYVYSLKSVDVNGIKSLPSVEVELITPESKQTVAAPKQTVKKEVVEAAPAPVVEEVKSVTAPVNDLDLSGL